MSKEGLTSVELRRSGSGDLSQYLFGKVQPQARDLENFILGAIIFQANLFEQVSGILTPESFYVDANQTIYKAIVTLHTAGHPIDLLTVTEQLRHSGELESVGGQFYITELTNDVTSVANIEYHARIVAEKKLARDLIHLGSGMIKDAYDETTDPFELLMSSESELLNLGSRIQKQEAKSIQGYVKQFNTDYIDPPEKVYHNDVAGAPTGLSVLDHATGGWARQELILFAARPAMGKTALMCTNVRKLAIMGIPTAVFSLEMSGVSVFLRLVAQEARVEVSRIKNRKLTEDELQRVLVAIEVVKRWPIQISQAGGLNTVEYRSQVKKLISKFGIEVVFLDYLQLMRTPKTKFREEEVSEIADTLKLSAKENDIPVVALSQLSREVEKRSEKNNRPKLSDLRSSGNLEQSADVIIFPYRPEYYKIREMDDGTPSNGVAEMIIEKQRNGKQTTVKCNFVEEYALFEDADDQKALMEVNPHDDIPF